MTRDCFGPFDPECDPLIRRAYLGILRGLLYAHHHSAHSVQIALTRAESGDPEALDAAQRAFDALPSIPRRKVLSSFASLVSRERAA